MEVAEGSECALIPALRLKGRDGERGSEGGKERATAMIRRDEEMSAQQVKGFMGEGGGVGKKKQGDWNPLGMRKERKHLGWLNSSQSLQQKSGRGKMEGRVKVRAIMYCNTLATAE